MDETNGEGIRLQLLLRAMINGNLSFAQVLLQLLTDATLRELRLHLNTKRRNWTFLGIY